MDDASAAPGQDLVRIADTDLANANLLVARLEAAGIPALLRTDANGMLPFTVGDMSRAHVWIRAGDLDAAREIAGASPSDGSVELPSRQRTPGAVRRRRIILIGVVLLLGTCSWYQASGFLTL